MRPEAQFLIVLRFVGPCIRHGVSILGQKKFTSADDQLGFKAGAGGFALHGAFSFVPKFTENLTREQLEV
jgi:hypothetical protein